MKAYVHFLDAMDTYLGGALDIFKSKRCSEPKGSYIFFQNDLLR